MKSKTQKEAQKARDVGLRDGLNEGEADFRTVLLQPVERVSERVVASALVELTECILCVDSVHPGSTSATAGVGARRGWFGGSVEGA